MLKPVFAVAALVVAAPAFAGGDSLTVTNYVCADNQVLRVAYLDTAAGTSFAVVLEQDELLPMARQVSASGAIYTSTNPNYAYSLLTKGETADLVATTNGKDTFVKKDCKAA